MPTSCLYGRASSGRRAPVLAIDKPDAAVNNPRPAAVRPARRRHRAKNGPGVPGNGGRRCPIICAGTGRRASRGCFASSKARGPRSCMGSRVPRNRPETRVRAAKSAFGASGCPRQRARGVAEPRLARQ
jgi:hypothetical protein